MSTYSTMSEQQFREWFRPHLTKHGAYRRYRAGRITADAEQEGRLWSMVYDDYTDAPQLYPGDVVDGLLYYVVCTVAVPEDLELEVEMDAHATS